MKGTLLAEGREAEVYARSDGNVLKLLRRPDAMHRVDREATALDALAEAGVAAPRAIEVVTVDGRPGLVMTRVAGDDLLAALGRSPLLVFRAGATVARVHAAMHEVAAPPALPLLHEELRRWIDAAPSLPDDRRRRVLAILDDLPTGDRLCHGDLHVGNVVGSWTNPVVIDWGNSTRGNPMADVARTDILQRFGVPPSSAPAVVRALAPFGRTLLANRYLRVYRKLRAAPKAEVERWRIVCAAARLAEHVPEEHPVLLRFLHQRLDR